MRQLLWLVLFVAVSITAQAQLLIDPPEALMQAHVDTVTVAICTGEGCIREVYVIDRFGRPIADHPAMVAVFETYAYDRAGRLVRTTVWSDHGDEPSVWSALQHHYGADGRYAYSVYGAQQEYLEVAGDTVHVDIGLANTCEGCARDATGKVTGRPLGELNYPCGVAYAGRHHATYSYGRNGLLDRCRVTDAAGVAVVELSYTYRHR